MADEQVRVRQYGNGEVRIVGLMKDEIEALLGMVAGANWIRAEDGRLVIESALEPAPPPQEDPPIAAWWPKDHPQFAQLEMFAPDFRAGKGGGIIIEHLCGYGWSREGYEKESQKLTDWGFECLRSKRGPDGRFWEMWFLSNPICAKGDLLETVQWVPLEKRTEAAIQFLCHNARFGSLSIATQRAAMTMDD